jgi:hypothetical protein
VSKKFYESNTTGNYKTKLAQDMNLEGNWEMGLAEVHYPKTWKVVKTGGWLTIMIMRKDTTG